MLSNIVYRYSSRSTKLYVNLIEKYNCTNQCLFCGRPQNDLPLGEGNIYEPGFSLFLEKLPSFDKIIHSIESELKNSDEYLSFVGLGEPLLNLQIVLDVIRTVKQRFDIKTNINTNGAAGMLYDNPVKQLENAGLDRISISLNAINESEYNYLCTPKLNNSFDYITAFIKECNKSSIDTYISFILGYQNNDFKVRTQQEYLEFALTLGLTEQQINWREYHSIL